MLLEQKKRTLKAFKLFQRFTSTQLKAQNRVNFITLKRIPEPEKIEIIQFGFQRNQEEKISLKDYYQGKNPYSLFQWKSYHIKYKSIQKTPLF